MAAGGIRVRTRRDVLGLLGATTACVCCTRSIAQQQITIALPELTPSTPKPGDSPSLPVLTHTPEEMAAAESGEVGNIRQALAQLSSINDSVKNLLAARDRAIEELRAIEAERDRILDEMRRGFFCSQCMRSKEEIERAGENFYAHLQRVNGHIVPATQSQIDSKSAEFDQSLARQQAFIDQFAKRIAQTQDEAKQAVIDVQAAILAWNLACGSRKDLISIQADKVNNGYEKDLAKATAALHRIRAEIAQLSNNAEDLPQQMARLRAGEKMWEDFIASTQLQADGALGDRWRAMRLANADRDSDYDQITDAFAKAGLTPSYVPSHTITVATTGISRYLPAAAPLDGYSVSMGPHGAIVGYQRGPLYAGIGEWGTLNDQKVGVLIKAFDYTASFGVSETRWTIDGGAQWRVAPSLVITKTPKDPSETVIKLPDLP